MDLSGLRQGDVVIANVVHPAHGHVDDKWRPAVFVDHADDGQAVLAGLTTLPAYADGKPRARIDWRGGPNGSASYLWGGRLVRVPTGEVSHVTGYLNDDDWVAVCDVHNIPLLVEPGNGTETKETA